MMPGGFGTMDEFFEVAKLIQTGKMKDAPMILVGKNYWSGLLNWISTTMVEAGTISKDDISLFKVLDTAEEVVQYVLEFYKRHPLKPNF